MNISRRFVVSLLAVMLPVMWLLSACGNTTNNNGNPGSTNGVSDSTNGVIDDVIPEEPKELISVVKNSSNTIVTDDGEKLYALSELTTSSPDGHIKALLWQDEKGGLYYSAESGTKEVIKPSKLGLTLSGCDFSEGIEEITTYDRTDEINDSYETALTISLANVSCRDHCIEREIFLKKSGGSMTLKVRVYDDGFAFRYADVTAGNGDKVTVLNELTDINLPAGTVTFAGGYSAAYEYNFSERSYDQLKNHEGEFNTPITAFTGDSWLLFSESDVYAKDITYIKSIISTTRSSAKLDWAFGYTRDPQNEVTADNGHPGHLRITEVETVNGFTTPWRVTIIGDDVNTLLNSDMIDSLCPAMDEDLFKDTSWIKPGKVAWSWWSGVSQTDYNAQIEFIDFASENGWEYCCLDDGWKVFEKRIEEICTYAKSKNVGIILWVSYRYLKTPEAIEELFSKWASWGVAGIKTDFFESEDIDVLESMRNCAEIGAKYKLMLYYHGCINPCGETRTYPNVMTTEAVLGEEYRRWSTSPSPANCLMYPFTRNVTGSMDYTPSCIAIPSTGESGGFSFAKAIVYESALQHYANSAYFYPSFIGLPLLNKMPTAWDKSTVFEGYPGKYITYIRQSGDDFYIGSMTLDARTVTVPLDFLGSGSYNAYIYYDDENGKLALEVRSVIASDSLTLEMRKTGGAAIMITKDNVDTKVAEPLNPELEGYTYYECENGKILGNAVTSISPRCSGGSKVGYLGKGKSNAVEIKVQVEEAGIYELIIYYCSGEKRSLDVIVNGETYSLQNLVSAGYDSPEAVSLKVELESGYNTVRLTCLTASAPNLDRIAVSNEPV